MTDKNKPAFPQCVPHPDDFAHGMTLRDYFAAKAMQVLLAAGIRSDQYEEDAVQAYKVADAMMKARDGD